MRSKWVSHLFTVSLLGMNALFFHLQAQVTKLQISDNHRFLETADGHPFIWIGDTNWFFAKLPPATLEQILDRRAAQGFTVMQISCREKLYNGEGPGPITTPNEQWWSYLDTYVENCAERGMYVGITLGWWSVAKRNSEKDLYRFGRWVGDRYKNQDNVVWLTLGEAGSHVRKDTISWSKLEALTRGIRDGDTGQKLLTIHADYRRGTSLNRDTELCDFNNWQTSQWCCISDLPRKDPREWTVWEAMTYDYNQRYGGSPKPTIDLEAWYENNKDFCGADPFFIRRRAYFTILAGGFGHTYGAGGIWDGLVGPDSCSSKALKALDYPGGVQVGYLGKLLMKFGHDFFKMMPDQELIVSDNPEEYDSHIQAARAHDWSFAVIYSADADEFSLDLTSLSSKVSRYGWYNPRSGTFDQLGKLEESDKMSSISFDPPGDDDFGLDWVLILGSKSFVNQLGED